MSTIVDDRPETGEMSPRGEIHPGYRGLVDLGERVKLDLEPFQRGTPRALRIAG